MKYLATVLVDASVCIEVEADNEEDAKTKAWDVTAERGVPGLCHQCAGELDVADFTGEIQVSRI